MKKKMYLLLFLFPLIAHKAISSMDIFQKDLKAKADENVTVLFDINDDELLEWTHNAYTGAERAFVRGQEFQEDKNFFMEFDQVKALCDGNDFVARYVYDHAMANGCNDEDIKKFIGEIFLDQEFKKRIEYENSDELRENLKRSQECFERNRKKRIEQFRLQFGAEKEKFLKFGELGGGDRYTFDEDYLEQPLLTKKERKFQIDLMKMRLEAEYKRASGEKKQEWEENGNQALMWRINDSVCFYENLEASCRHEALKDLNILIEYGALDREKLRDSSKIGNKEDADRIEALRKRIKTYQLLRSSCIPEESKEEIEKLRQQIKEKTTEKMRTKLLEKQQEWLELYPDTNQKNKQIFKVLCKHSKEEGSGRVWSVDDKLCALIDAKALDYGFGLYHYANKYNDVMISYLLNKYFPKTFSEEKTAYNSSGIKNVFDQHKVAILYTLEQFAYLGNYEIVTRILQIISVGYGPQEFLDDSIIQAKKNAFENACCKERNDFAEKEGLESDLEGYIDFNQRKDLSQIIKSCMIKESIICNRLDGDVSQAGDSSELENDYVIDRYFEQKTLENLQKERKAKKEKNRTGRKRKREGKGSDAGRKKKKRKLYI